MATSDTPGAPPPPAVSADPVVARYKLENYVATRDGLPDEGQVTVYENKTKITDLSGLVFAPIHTALFKLNLYNAASREPITEIDAKTAAMLKAKVMAVFDPKNTTQGPELSESSRPFNMTRFLEKLDDLLKDPEERIAAHLTDIDVWGSVLSGSDEVGSHPGATLGIYASKSKFGILDGLYVGVQSGPGPQPAAAFREYVQKRISSEKGITYGELATSMQYGELIHLAKRNAHRLAFELLVEIGMVNAVDHYSDPHAIASADETEVPSKLIRSSSILASVTSDVLVRFNKDAVAFYSRAAPYAATCKTLITVLHPAQGLAVYVRSGAPTQDESDECFSASGSAKGHPLTPAREENPKYDPAAIKEAYVDTGAVLETFIASRNFGGRDSRTLTQPQGACPGEWRILSPVAVFAE